MTSDLRLESFSRGDALVLRPCGDLAKDTCAQLWDGLLACAAQEPPAIVVDLDSLRMTGTTALAVFPSVWMRINDWPGIPMVLVAQRQPLRALLASSSVPWFVPTYPSVAEAVAALQTAPPRRRLELSLSCDVASGRLARRVVADTCHAWAVSEVAGDAVLVASELTENVIRHAGSAGWLRLGLRGRAFTVAMADADPRPPRLRSINERSDGGRGLALIAELSRAWGYVPRAQGGKVVWVVLTVPGG